MRLRIESSGDEATALLVEEDALDLKEFEETLPFLKHFSGRLRGTHSYIDSSLGTLVLHPAGEDGQGFQVVIPLKHVRTFNAKELEGVTTSIFFGPTTINPKP